MENSGGFWKNKRILVTGGGGFIGSFVVQNLLSKRGVSPENVIIPRSANFDLRNFNNCRKVTKDVQIVLHLAAKTGGISFSRSHPASQYYDSMLMNLHVLEASRQAGVEKFVGIGNLLIYPVDAPSPLKEEYLQTGSVAETHLGVGTSKRDLILMAKMYHMEYGLNAVNVVCANAYGPCDRFDPKVSHVIPATISKCHQAGNMVVWGDGKPTRDFLYVEDIAEGIVLAAERLNAPNYFVNLASGEEISIGDLSKLIAELCDFKGNIEFDISKKGGDPRRTASGERGKQLLGFSPKVSLREGLIKTISWYREQVKAGNKNALLGH